MTASKRRGGAFRKRAAPLRAGSSIREEVRRLALDATDREEMRIIREQIAQLAAAPSTERAGRGADGKR